VLDYRQMVVSGICVTMPESTATRARSGKRQRVVVLAGPIFASISTTSSRQPSESTTGLREIGRDPTSIFCGVVRNESTGPWGGRVLAPTAA